jgi:hypothetical protein
VAGPSAEEIGKAEVPSWDSTERNAAIPVRDSIFMCYSHHDAVLYRELKKMLSPVVEPFRIWDDTMIPPGAQWRQEIMKALATAKAAVLLVSPSFLNSDLIATNELPPLLDAAQKGGCRILWIKVEESLVDQTSIGQYQAVYNDLALKSLKKAARQGALAEIVMEIVKVIFESLGPNLRL